MFSPASQFAPAHYFHIFSWNFPVGSWLRDCIYNAEGHYAIIMYFSYRASKIRSQRSFCNYFLMFSFFAFLRHLIYLFQNLFNETKKDLDSWRNRGLFGCNVRGISEYSLKETRTMNSVLGSAAWSQQTEQQQVCTNTMKSCGPEEPLFRQSTTNSDWSGQRHSPVRH